MNDVIAKRAARIAFGLVLLASMALLVHFAENDAAPGWLHAWHMVVATWLLAPLVAAVTYVVAGRFHPRNSDALRRAALSVPAVGAALFLSLTLHLPFWISKTGGHVEWQYAVFSFGALDMIFALFVWRRARALTRAKRPLSIGWIFVVMCALAAFPYIIPAVFVGLSLLPFIPLLLWMETIAAKDREASHVVPFAIARTA